MNKLFELAFVLMCVVLCAWRLALPFYWALEMLADDAAREERRRRRRSADQPGRSDGK